jgi:peptide/nickel transport system ATP-binding protein
LLEVEHLTVRRGTVGLVEDVSLKLGRGERLGIIGESGCGKSMTALTLMGLTPFGLDVTGSVRFLGQPIWTISERERCKLRGSRLSMVFQEPATALDPLMRVGEQIAEVLRLHRRDRRRVARAHALELMARVGLDDPERLARAYPHQLSGGQRQRVMLAIAIACGPDLLIADEPTTALDAVTQQGVLCLIDELVNAEQMALLLISHDLGVVSSLCSRLAVMYGGSIVEQGPADELLARPVHPYTAGLVATAAAVSSFSGDPGERHLLPSIPGSVEPPAERGAGCAFAKRCWRATPRCVTRPALRPVTGRSLSTSAEHLRETRNDVGDDLVGHVAACWHPLGSSTLAEPGEPGAPPR